MLSDRTLRWALVILAASGLAGGGLGVVLRRPDLADWLWAAGTIPIVAALAFGIVKDLLRGRFGVDAVALISMGAALAFADGGTSLWLAAGTGERVVRLSLLVLFGAAVYFATLWLLGFRVRDFKRRAA